MAVETAIAKVASDLVGNLKSLIAPFSDPVMGEIGLYIADKIRFIRFKNSIYVLKRARELLSEHGLEPQRVDTKILVPILEGACLEEDNDLVEPWARLLATASSGHSITPSFPSILSELSPLDAEVLNWIWKEGEEQIDTRIRKEPIILIGRAYDVIDITEWQLHLVVDNLIRLGLASTGQFRKQHLSANPKRLLKNQAVSLTVLGIEFVASCNGPSVDIANWKKLHERSS